MRGNELTIEIGTPWRLDREVAEAFYGGLELATKLAGLTFKVSDQMVDLPHDGVDFEVPAQEPHRQQSRAD